MSNIEGRGASPAPPRERPPPPGPASRTAAWYALPRTPPARSSIPSRKRSVSPRISRLTSPPPGIRGGRAVPARRSSHGRRTAKESSDGYGRRGTRTRRARKDAFLRRGRASGSPPPPPPPLVHRSHLPCDDARDLPQPAGLDPLREHPVDPVRPLPDILQEEERPTEGGLVRRSRPRREDGGTP